MKMSIQNRDYWEILGDFLEDLAEWEDFEADMASDPYKVEG